MANDELMNQIQEIVVATVPALKGVQITEESTLGTLGLDSIKLVEIGVRIEQKFGNKIVLDQWITEETARGEGSFSIGSLLRFIEKNR